MTNHFYICLPLDKQSMLMVLVRVDACHIFPKVVVNIFLFFFGKVKFFGKVGC